MNSQVLNKTIAFMISVCLIVVNIPDVLMQAAAESISDIASELIIEAEPETISDSEESAIIYNDPIYAVNVGEPNSSSTIQDKIDEISERTDKSGVIMLDRDYQEDIEIPPDTTVALDLNGYSFAPEGKNIRNHVVVYGTFILRDGNGGGIMNGTSPDDTRGINILKGGSFIMESGTICNYTVEYSGAGVYVQNGGRFVMKGGEITGNATALFGGGVYAVNSADVSLEGNGVIADNSAKEGGGIYYANSILPENAPYDIGSVRLDGNTAYSNGGGAYFNAAANVILTDKISVVNNSAGASGGGIYFDSSVNAGGSNITINGCTINGNHAGKNGGGIGYSDVIPKSNYVIALNSGEITENEALLNGGGIFAYEKCRFIMNNGNVDRNKAAQYGGGICLLDASNTNNTTALEFTMRGGTINENELNNSSDTRTGGGIIVNRYSVVNLYGGEICNNRNARVGGGIAIGNECTVNVTPDPEDSSIRDIQICGNKLSAYTKNGIGVGGGMYVNTTSSTGTGFTMTCGNISQNGGAESDRGVRGGGIYFEGGSKKITGGNITENTAYRNTLFTNDNYGGGGIYNVSGSITIGTRNLHLQNNTATNCYGGGIYNYYGTLEVYDTEISGNKASCGGGILHNWHSGYHSVLNVIDADIINNTASTGGGIAGYRGLITIGGRTRICYNETTASGGGMYMKNASAEVYIKDSATISYNKGTTGGGANLVCNVYMQGDSVVEHNTATSDGGGLRARFLTMSQNAVIQDNTSTSRGGGTYVDYRLTMSENAVIQNNTSNGNGGGAYLYVYNILMDGGKIINNTSKSSGGGVFLNGRAKLTSIIEGGAEISGNTASSNGGGLFSSQEQWNANNNDASWRYGTSVVVRDAKICNNYAVGSGGAFYLNPLTRLELEEGAVITGNSADSSGGGITVDNRSPYQYLDANGQRQPIHFADYDESDPYSDYTFVINSGVVLKNNSSRYGRDLYVNGNYYNTSLRFRRPYVYISKANTMSGASTDAHWIDELTGEEVSGAVDNFDLVTQLNERNESGAPIDTSTVMRYVYTFTDSSEKVARIGETEYGSIGAAIEAIVNDETGGDTKIFLLKDHNEDVVAPSGSNITLDINGHELAGLAQSTITVEEGAEFTVMDGSSGKTGALTRGRGTPLHFSGENHQTSTPTVIWSYGGAIYNKGTLTLRDVKLYQNFANYGSAIYCDKDYATELNIYDCEIYSNPNTSSIYGNGSDTDEWAVRCLNTKLTMERTVIRNSTRHCFHMKCLNPDIVSVIKDCTFTGNAKYSMWIDGSTNIKIIDTTFTKQSNGQFVHTEGNTHVEFSGCKFNENTAGEGLYCTGSSVVTIKDNCEFIGNNLRSLWALSTSKVYVSDAVFKNTNNTSADYSVIALSNGSPEVHLTNCDISNNIVGYGAIYQDTGTLYLHEGTEVYDNKAYSSRRSGGVDLVGGKMYLVGGKVYDNYLGTQQADIYLGNKAYFYRDETKEYDTRCIDNWNISNSNCWYCRTDNNYVVKGEHPDIAGYENIYGMEAIVNSNNMVVGTHSLASYYLSINEDFVAQVVEEDGSLTKFIRLESAIQYANEQDREVLIEMLADTVESLEVDDPDTKIIVDLKGHNITNAQNRYYLFNVTSCLTIMDSVGGGTLLPNDHEPLQRAIVVSGGELYLKSGTIDGFQYNSGAGVCAVNRVVTIGGVKYYYDCKIVMDEDFTIKNCTATTDRGGGMYYYCADIGSATPAPEQSHERKSLTIKGKFENCTATNGGGLTVYQTSYDVNLENNVTLDIIGAEFIGCKSTAAANEHDNIENSGGGGIYVYDYQRCKTTINMENALFDGCEAVRSGGGVKLLADHNYASITTEVKDCTFINCKCGYVGGGFEVSKANVSYMNIDTHISHCNFDNCQAGYGGGLAIYYRYGEQRNTTTGDIYTVNAVVNDGTVIRNCHANSNGGGIYYERSHWYTLGTLDIYDVIIEDCYAGNVGGAMCLWRPSTYYDGVSYPFHFGKQGYNTTIRNNTAYAGGGGVYSSHDWVDNLNYDNEVYMDSVDFIGNRTARLQGLNSASYGGMYLRCARADVRNCNFIENHAVTSYAGIHIQYPLDVYIENCKAIGNVSENGGWAGITYDTRADAKLEFRNEEIHIKNCESYNNISKNGSGAGFASTTQTTRKIFYENCNIHDNTVSNSGGGLYHSSAAELHLVNTKIHDNVSTYTYTASDDNSNGGGGVYAITILNFILEQGTEIYNNTSQEKGGGIHLWNSGFSIPDDTVRIHDNTSKYQGGGVYWRIGSSRNINLLGGTFENNVSTNGNGGGMYAYRRDAVASDMHFEKVKFLNNTCNSNGGGLWVGRSNTTGESEVTITDCEFMGNTANYGGALYNYHWTYTTIGGDTLITENKARIYGGGIYVEYGNPHLYFVKPAKIYGNTALLGQDLYSAYSGSYRDTRITVYNPVEMFEDDDDIRSDSIQDDYSTRLYTNMTVKLSPTNNIYALRVIYTSTKDMVAVVDNKCYCTVQDAVDYVMESGIKKEIIMIADTKESIDIPAGCKAVLNLNGYTLEGAGTTTITCVGELDIIDAQRSGTAEITYESGGTSTQEYACKTDEDGNRTRGTITGLGSGTSGAATTKPGGVFVNGGTVKMSGGQIADCRNAGVRIDMGTFELAGGKICNNTSTHGAAVRVSSIAGTFLMTGGEVCNNSTTSITPNNVWYSGAIHNLGIVNILGGKIHDNTSTAWGAAIFNRGTASITHLEGYEEIVINNNVSTQQGGAIFNITGSLIIENAVIKDNKTTAALISNTENADQLCQGAGGAIMVYSGTCTIGDGALIQNNEANRGGAIYQRSGTVNIFGGTITNNRAIFGGGCSQCSVVNNCVMNITSGKIYRNIALSSYGNDLYSAYEGNRDYETNYVLKKYVPHMNIIAAYRMGLSNYNVWKNDQYTGSVVTGYVPNECQYLISDIRTSNNLSLTAIHYNVETDTVLDTSFRINQIKILNIANNKDGMLDGTSYFDTTKNNFDNAIEKEKTAKDMLDENLAEYSDETYIYNGESYRYISYNGKLYEQEQAVEWWAGNDSGDTNGIVRTYDKINYSIYSNITSEGTVNLDSSKIYRRWIKVTLPCSKTEAEFDVSASKFTTSPKITQTLQDGRPVQILTGYWDEKVSDGGLFKTNTIAVQLYSMKNGETLKPAFESWVDGNIENEAAHAECSSKTLTVSAAPKYNITVKSNSSLINSIRYGYFNIDNGYEISEEEYKSMSEAEKKSIIYGAIFGYGITVELYNDPDNKGLKGVELPESELEFDLNFKGTSSIKVGDVIVAQDKNPLYIWAYKPSDTVNTGYALGSTVRDRNMLWNDDDDRTKYTGYVYDAAPYNTGNSDVGCYNGGHWFVEGSQPDSSDPYSTVHVKVSDYTFPNSASASPIATASNSRIFNYGYIKPFSAGYIQVIYPIDYHDIEKTTIDLLQIEIEAATSKVNMVSISGQRPEDVENKSNLNTPEKVKKDLDTMNNFFLLENSDELKTSGLAVNERTYADNYCGNIVSSSYATHEEGSVKYNNIVGPSTWTEQGIIPLDSDTTMSSEIRYYSTQYRSDDKNNSAYFASNDPLYSVNYWDSANIEYDYMTAANILQKFDADVFTPYGGAAVINRAVSNKSSESFCNGNFSLSIFGEGETSWSSTATRSYQLTILYGAKPDGSNWTKIPLSNKEAEYRMFADNADDGGTADMYATGEKNLLYFRTMDELRAYFRETKGIEDAKCVALLYEVRNCCIRSTRSITINAKMKVTDDYKYIGNTYCVTNEARLWKTYRPHYKLYYAEGSVKQHTHQDSWANHIYDDSVEDAVAYGFIEDDEELKYSAGTCNPSDYDANTPDGRTAYAIYNLPYRKTQYANGKEVLNGNGTDKGDRRFGRSLLMSSVDSNITLFNITKEENSDSVKEVFDIVKGERNVSFKTIPELSVIDHSKTSEFVQSTEVRTNVLIEVYIPKGLTIDTGSIDIDYNDKKYPSDYNFLEWQQKIEEQESGDFSQIVTFSTYVKDVSLNLPVINFNCFIGDTMNPDKDISSSCDLTISARIGTSYDLGEDGRIDSSSSKSSSQVIHIKKDYSRGIVMDVEKRIIDLRDDMVFYMTYDNYDSQKTTFDFINVLPYNNDGRDTEFTGGYRVKSVSTIFYDEFSFEGNKDNVLYFLGKQKNPSTSSIEATRQVEQAKFFNDLENSSDLKSKTGVRLNPEKYTITYNFADDECITLAEDDFGWAFMMKMRGEIEEESRMTVKFVLSPLENDEEQTNLIVSEVGTDESKWIQTSGCTYADNSFFATITDTGTRKSTVTSNTVELFTINHVITGTVFIDRNKDGAYMSKTEADTLNKEFEGITSYLPEYTLSDIDVYLYDAIEKEDEDGNVTYIMGGRSVDVNGYTVPPTVTDENGYYSFSNLGEARYFIAFDDGRNRTLNELKNNYHYNIVSENNKVGEVYMAHPLDFDMLAVTDYRDANFGNRCVGVYDSNLFLDSAVLAEPVNLEVPDEFYLTTHEVGDCNLGLYYTEYEIKKEWQNMVQGVPYGTTVSFDLTGRQNTDDEDGEEVYSGTIMMTKIVTTNGVEALGYVDVKNNNDISYGVSNSDVKVIQKQTDDVFTWTMSDNVILSARNGKGDIVYTISEPENGVSHISGESNLTLSDYYKCIEQTEEFDSFTGVNLYKAVNQQLLGSVTIISKDGNNNPLNNVGLSLYQTRNDSASTGGFIPYSDGVGSIYKNEYQKYDTATYYKVTLAGGEDDIKSLIELGLYDEFTNRILIHPSYQTATNQCLYLPLHKELDEDDNEVISYYFYSPKGVYELYDDEVNKIDWESELINEAVSVVIFNNLPMYDDDGMLYYSIRETTVPKYYYATADFTPLTDMDVMYGYTAGNEYLRDICFELINTKRIMLPLSGENALRCYVISGTVATLLGCTYIIWFVRRRRKKKC